MAVTAERRSSAIRESVGYAISGLLTGAIPFEPLSAFRDDPTTRLDEAGVLIIDGDKDSRR